MQQCHQLLKKLGPFSKTIPPPHRIHLDTDKDGGRDDDTTGVIPLVFLPNVPVKVAVLNFLKENHNWDEPLCPVLSVTHGTVWV